MKKTIKSIALLAGVLLSVPQAFSASITNGDFASSCSLAGWGQDSIIADGNEFSVGGSSPSCTADIIVSDSSYSNTLYQTLDLSAQNADSSFLLSMDFSLSSDDFGDDLLSIGLIDAERSMFIEIFSGYFADIVGSGAFHQEFALDNSYMDQSWDLEFGLEDEIDDFASGDDVGVSMLSISNVALTEVAAPVPEPTSLALFALALAGLFNRRKLANEVVRRTIKK